MADIHTPKWNSEVSPEQSKDERDKLKEKLKKHAQMFIGESTQGNPNIFLGYKDADDYFDTFQKYLWKKWELDATFNDFLALNKDFCKNTLKSLLTAYGVQRNQLLKSIDTSFRKQFNFASLNPTQTGEIQDAYMKFSNTQLKDVVVSQFVREKFVKKVLGFSTGEYNHLLQHNKQDEQLLKAIFGNIPPNITNDAEAMDILKGLQHLSHLSADDLQKFLWYLDEDKKLSFVEYFLPTLTLKEALELQLITQAEKNNLLRQTLRENGITDPAQISEMITDIEEHLVHISTHSLKTGIKTKFQDEGFLHRVLKEYHLGAENVTDSLKIENFDMLKSKILSDKNIPDTIKNQFKNFKEWSYVNFIYTQGTLKQDNYFLIGDLSTQIKLTNINAWPKKVFKGDVWSHETMSYDELYNHLRNISAKESLGFQVLEKKAMEKLKQESLEEMVQPDTIENKQELFIFLKNQDPDYNGDENAFMMVCDPEESSETSTSSLTSQEVFKVKSIDTNWVFIEGQPKMGFDEFAQAFEVRKVKRLPLISHREDFYAQLQALPEYREKLKDIELKDWKLKYNQNTVQKKGNIEYFTGKWDIVMRVKKLDDGSVTFEQWKFKEGSGDKKKTVFISKWTWKNIDYNNFFIFCKEKWFTPYTKNLPETPLDNKNDFHPKKWFFKSWWGCMSIADIIAGSKQFISSIEEYLKVGNQLKSAKFALAMGKMLPEQIRHDLQTRVYSEEKKIMEDTMSKLKSRNTDDMIKAIEEILKTSKPFDPELEAALMTTISKYHFLYPKALKKYKWTFRWYQALGWSIWDSIFIEHKNYCESAWIPFTEEYLIEKLLWIQVKKGQRRNKFDKDYGGYRTSWLNDEISDGEAKTKDFATADGRIEYCMWEFWNLTYGNGIGGMENVWAKWPDPAYKMNTLPFVILASGMSLDFTQPVINKVKAYWYTTPFSSLALVANQSKVENYIKYVEKVIELLGNSNMLSAFQWIQKKSLRADKIQASYQFWKEYGAELYPKINMNDGFVLSQKDDKGKEQLKWYYDTIKWGVHDTLDFQNGIKKDTINDGSFSLENSPVAATGWLLDTVEFGDGGSYRWSSEPVFHMHLQYFKEVIHDESIPLEKRKVIFFDKYKSIERHVYNKISWYLNRGKAWGYKKYTCIRDAHKHGIDLFPEELTVSEYHMRLEEKWQEFLDGRLIPTEEISQRENTTKMNVEQILAQSNDSIK